MKILTKHKSQAQSHASRRAQLLVGEAVNRLGRNLGRFDSEQLIFWQLAFADKPAGELAERGQAQADGAGLFTGGDEFGGVLLGLRAGKLHGVLVALAPLQIQPHPPQRGRDGGGGLVLREQVDLSGVQQPVAVERWQRFIHTHLSSWGCLSEPQVKPRSSASLIPR